MHFLNRRSIAAAKLGAICAGLVLLAACVTSGSTNVPRDVQFGASDPAGMAMIGVYANKECRLAFMRYDPATKRVAGEWISGGDSWSPWRYTEPGAEFVFPDGGQQQYALFKFSPGDYAFVGTTAINVVLQRMRSIQTTGLISQRDGAWFVHERTPVFTVTAGQVAYIGEVDLDCSIHPARISFKSDPAKAERELAGYSGISAPMQVNQIKPHR